MQMMLTIGGNKNVELLKLNDNWKLPEEYALEVVEVDGIIMEWVQKRTLTPIR